MVNVIYNGVDPDVLFGLSPSGRDLIDRLALLTNDLSLLMPVRITQAKNIELGLQLVAALKTRGFQVRLLVTGPPDPHDTQNMTYYRSLQALRLQLKVEQEARFVFESGPDPEQVYFIDEQMVAELFWVSDALFMPSHREGFGMPVLEAGLVGLPVICTDIPAAQEIGGEDVWRVDASAAPELITDLILARLQHSQVYQLRRRVRQNYSWPAIFRREIGPLLSGEKVAP